MRIISGNLRGTKLVSLNFSDNTIRPTTDKVKQAIYNCIQFEIENANILELFAGTGQLGIEALSRGANSATFVDNSSHACNIIKENLKKTNLLEYSKVFNKTAKNFLESNFDLYDIILLDPPYNKNCMQNISLMLKPNLKPSSIVIYEYSKKTNSPNDIGGLSRYKAYTYGQISFDIYRNII